jgi:phosphatidylglycerol lysyltransferase
MIAFGITQPPLVEELAANRLEQFAFLYGQNYDSYLVTEPGWRPFWSADQRGVVATVRRGRSLFVGGGLLAPEPLRENLLGELVQYAEAQRLLPIFFNIAQRDLPVFARFGFQATKWGEEALVDLGQCTWSGRAYEWVRRQANYCRRQGLVVEECQPNEPSPEAWEQTLAEIADISQSFLADKPQSGEIPWMESNFDPRQLGRKRIFVARSDSGRIEGFLASNPSRNGAMWTMETYRRRPDAVRGTLPYLIHQAMRTLQDEGVRTASLCLIPGLRCETPMPGDSWLVRRGVVFGAQQCGMVFNGNGLYHFKSAFRPEFESRYLCARPRMTIAAIWNFISLLGVLRLDSVKMLGRLLRHRGDAGRDRPALRTPPRELKGTGAYIGKLGEEAG